VRVTRPLLHSENTTKTGRRQSRPNLLPLPQLPPPSLLGWLRVVTHSNQPVANVCNTVERSRRK